MINKYAEIQQRIRLYNACKGILRVKIAEEVAATAPVDANSMRARFGRGLEWAGNNKATLAGGAVGAVGGGAAGYYGGNWLANKMGLDPRQKGWRGWLGTGIKYTGAALGAGLGAVTGGGFADHMNNSFKADQAVSNEIRKQKAEAAVLERARLEERIKAEQEDERAKIEAEKANAAAAA